MAVYLPLSLEVYHPKLPHATSIAVDAKARAAAWHTSMVYWYTKTRSKGCTERVFDVFATFCVGRRSIAYCPYRIPALGLPS